MIKTLLTAALVAITGMASAGSVLDYVPPVAPVVAPPTVAVPVESPFDGFYVGISIKAMESANEFNYAAGSRHAEIVTPNLSGDGYGLYAGYGKANNNIYLGVELNAQVFGNSDSVDCHGSCYTCSAGIDNLINLRARIGYITGRTLLYVHGGYSIANVTAGVSWTDGSHGQNASGQVGGVAYGAGAEYAINDHMKIGVDYTINDLDPLTFQAFGNEQVSSFSNQEIMVRIGWTF